MENEELSLQEPSVTAEESKTERQNAQTKKLFPDVPFWGCILLMIAMIGISATLTFALTTDADRKQYTPVLEAQQNALDNYRESGCGELLALQKAFESNSYYADSLDEKELMTIVLKAYAESTGDNYAHYYTAEEYAAVAAQNEGSYAGIGVSVTQKCVYVGDALYICYHVVSVYENSPAKEAGMKVGDFIYGVFDGEELVTLNEIGYDGGLSLIRGEEGTDVKLAYFRENAVETYEAFTVTVTRENFVSQSVSGKRSTLNPKVGIVRIENFDLTTPGQFKETMNALIDQGADSFVFDVRNNPGGDLQSIRAVLCYLLKEGDLILSAIDKNGNTASSVYVGAVTHTGEYASCSVSEEEIGMYANRGFRFAVLCNENTASAAEVFTASLRDYEIATTVGETTFGKGIMQSIFSLSRYGDFSGYVKLTTHAYVTECGVSYHGTGILPDVEISLSKESAKKSLYELSETEDEQLVAALGLFSPQT